MVISAKSNREVTMIFLLFLISAGVRWLAVTVLSIEPVSDSAAYMNMASTMLADGNMLDLKGNVAMYSSGYPLFLVPFFAIFGDTPQVAQYVNALLGGIGVVLVYLCSKRLFENKWLMVLPALLWAFYPPAILYTEYIAKENLMVVLLMLQVLLLLYFPSANRKIFIAVLLGINFGLQLLVGPAILLTGAMIFLVVSNLLLNKNQNGLTIKPFLVVILVSIVVVAPWLGYTYNKLGKPVLNTNGGFNLYLGNNPSADVFFSGIQNTPMGPHWHDLKKRKGEVEASAILKSKAISYALDNPLTTMKRSVKKVIYFWLPPIHEGEGGNKSTLESLVRMAWLVYYILLLTGCFLILLKIKKLMGGHLVIIGTVASYAVIYAAAYIIFRYRLPIMPLVCILSVTGLSLFLPEKDKSIE